ncbi:ABC-three component system middle component 1 [Acinetobacter sp. CFCC 11171]|uniref:ABC-three component system middle component 1 n=1 Tax=Acinetobacter sp. CFCC 11171 TaxID=1775558 RepID=UPI000DD07FAE|nr:ABC-three component system middle component 1 [Acinetobacter sp. CFCC 11171]
MLNDVINEALKLDGFDEVFKNDSLIFFKKEQGDYKRYIICYSVESLHAASSINEYVLNNTPEYLKELAAFSKNTDLIVFLCLENLSEFKKIEKDVFETEEDAFFFKKYVLYFMNQEVDLIENMSFDEIKNVLSNSQAFGEYKKNPLSPSLYSFIARIFIKLPFLEMPKTKQEIVPINLQVQNLVSELGAEFIFDNLKNIDEDTDFDFLIEEMIKNEMED